MSDNVTAVELRRGEAITEGFGTREVRTQHEIAVAGIVAREQATIQAEYLMALKSPRVWQDVRSEMLSHCRRPRFSEVARYAKPIGKEFVNGEWVEKFARGFSARFAETLCQEMANIKPFSVMTYDDDALRILRFGVVDLQKNIIRSREVTFAKAVERKGKKIKGAREPRDYDPAQDWGQLWEPPDRELINAEPRINTYGDPVWLVKATDDEMRNKINSEESKTQRDFILKLCPRDILEDCEYEILDVLAKEIKTDPLAVAKRLTDRFREAYGLRVSDLQTYLGKEFSLWGEPELRVLRELGVAIRDGHTTFEEALKAKQGGAGEKAPDIAAQMQTEEKIRQAEAANAARAAEQNKPAETAAAAETKTETASKSESPQAAGAQPQQQQSLLTDDPPKKEDRTAPQKPMVELAEGQELPDAFDCAEGDRARFPTGKVVQVIDGQWKVIKEADKPTDEPKQEQRRAPVSLPKRGR